MAREKKLQTEIVNWLRANGVYVIKTKPGMGTPVGCPDIIGLYEDRFLAIEVKADVKSHDQPGQLATLQRLALKNYFVFRVDPTNWPVAKQKIQTKFF